MQNYYLKVNQFKLKLNIMMMPQIFVVGKSIILLFCMLNYIRKKNFMTEYHYLAEVA